MIRLTTAMLLLASLASITGAGEDRRPVVAVRDFFVRGSIVRGSITQPDAGEIVADLLRAELAKRFRVVPAETVRNDTGARTIMLSTVDGRGAIVARGLGAGHLVIGRLSGLGRSVILEGIVVGAGEGSRPTRALLVCPSIESVPAYIPSLVHALGLPRTPKPPEKAKAAPEVATAAQVMEARLSSPDSGVRFSTIVDLGKKRDVRATRALCHLLTTDEDLFVRRACARSLGHIGSKDAIPSLITALTDAEVYVSIEAGNALNKITGRETTVGPGSLEERQARQTEWRAWLAKSRAAEETEDTESSEDD